MEGKLFAEVVEVVAGVQQVTNRYFSKGVRRVVMVAMDGEDR